MPVYRGSMSPHWRASVLLLEDLRPCHQSETPRGQDMPHGCATRLASEQVLRKQLPLFFPRQSQASSDDQVEEGVLVLGAHVSIVCYEQNELTKHHRITLLKGVLLCGPEISQARDSCIHLPGAATTPGGSKITSFKTPTEIR